jgi:putative transposase
VKAVAQATGVARSNLHEQLKGPALRKPRMRPDDEWLLPMIRKIVAERASYGYRRVTALLNRQLAAEGRVRVNHKRIYRIMRIHHLLRSASA